MVKPPQNLLRGQDDRADEASPQMRIRERRDHAGLSIDGKCYHGFRGQ
jgi:hypothetical protein